MFDVLLEIEKLQTNQILYEENSIIPTNLNTQYSNTFSNYKSQEINNNINNKYLKAQPKK